MDILSQIDELFSREKQKFIQSKISLYKIITRILNSTGQNYEEKYVNENLKEFNISLNNKRIDSPKYIICNGDIIDINGERYFVVDNIKNQQKINEDNLSVEYTDLLLQYINSLKDNSKIDSIFDPSLSNDEINILISYHVKYYFELTDQVIKIKIIKFLDEYSSILYKKLDVSDKSQNYEKLEKLKRKQDEIESNFKSIIDSIDDIVKINTIEIEIRRIIKSLEAKYLFLPFLESRLINVSILDILFKPFRDLNTFKKREEKIELFNKHRKNYENYIHNCKKSSTKTRDILIPMGEKLFHIFKNEVFGTASGNADLYIERVDKKYPLHYQTFTVYIKLVNKGAGFAHDVLLIARSDDLEIKNYTFEKRSFNGEMVINIPVYKVNNNIKPKINLDISWINIDSIKKSKSFQFIIEEQDKNIPWNELKKRQPYLLVAVTDREKLLGRDEIIDELTQNIISNNITSFIIYGQKRVGKTSVVRTIEKYFNNNYNDVVIAYVDSTLQRQENTDDTINRLVINLCSDIKRKLLKKYKEDKILHQKIQNIHSPYINNSLTPIEDFIYNVEEIFDNIKIILIIDEFDELGYDLYVPNNKSETFFNNLRGLNNKSQNLGIILVGSENIPKIYNWHGQKLNNWKNRKIDIFDLTSEYEIYKNLIVNPVSPYIKFHDEAIFMLHELSGGNPYFTNMICNWIFDIAYDKKDTDITSQDIEEALSKKLGKEAKTSFQHFWMDGILEMPSMKDFIADLRRRTLKAIADSMKDKYNISNNYEVTRENICKNFIYPPKEIKLKSNECENQIRDFVSRGILNCENELYRLKPKLFEIWLIKYGTKEIIEGISDIEDIIREQEADEKYKISDEDLLILKNKIKINDNVVPLESIIEWLSQFDTNYEKRYFFNLLSEIKNYSGILIKEIFEKIYSEIFKGEIISLTKYTGLKRFKRDNALVSFLNYGKDEKQILSNYFTSYAQIHKKYCHKFDLALDIIDEHINHFIIIEPVIDDFEKLIEDLDKLKSVIYNNQHISNLNVHLVTILGVDPDISKFEHLLKVDYNWIKFYCYEKVHEDKIKPFKNLTDEKIIDCINNKLKNLKKVNYNYENSKNLLFEYICPQYSIPFYWFKDEITPLFPNFFELYYFEDSKGENYRNECYFIGNELELCMLNVVKKLLILKYGNEKNDWWINGIPVSVREKCAVKRESENQAEHESSYLDFINYSDIAKANFSIMGDVFFYDEFKDEWSTNIGKEKGISWLTKLNMIRRKYSHVVKSPPNKLEYEYLKKMKEKFMDNLKKHNIY